MKTTEQRRNETIATLLNIRESAALDLATMPSTKQGSQWAADRIKDVDYANRQLNQIGWKATA